MGKDRVLIKKVCKHCINQTKNKWNKTDDKLWIMGKIVCPHIKISPSELLFNDIDTEAFQEARVLVNEYKDGDWPSNIKRVLVDVAPYSDLISTMCQYRLEHSIKGKKKG